MARISEGQRSARQPPIVSFRGGNLLGQSNSYRRKDEKSLLGTIPRGDDFYVETQVLLLLGSQGGIYLGFTTTQSGYSVTPAVHLSGQLRVPVSPRRCYSVSCVLVPQ